MIPGDPPGRIPVLNRQRRYKINRKAVAGFCGRLLGAIGLQDRALSVVFLGIREMRLMNRRYRGKDYATDVLSFSYEKTHVEGDIFLGEILVAPAVAAAQALCYKVEPEKELRKLLVHGILHLLGYDHETDKGRMNRMQSQLMRRKFFFEPPSLADLKVKR